MSNLARSIHASLRRIKQKLVVAPAPTEQPAPQPAEEPGVEPASRDIWAERHLDPHYWQGMIHWGQVPQVAAYINRRISGDPHKDFLTYTFENYLAPLRAQLGRPVRMLSLCTGVGQMEMSFVKQNYVDSVLGLEVSQGCVDAANQTCEKEGLSDRISFRQADLNSFEMADDERFDVILNEAALHHISNLEHLIAQCKKVSHSHALFINHDYIGPNHHQWTEKQLKYINSLMKILPSELRASITNPGAIHEVKNSLPMEQMLEIDPTEGVRSEDILDVMAQHFTISDMKPFGGTLLHMLLNDMAGNFCKPEHTPIVNLLIHFEESLITEGALASDFAYWIGRPRTN